MKFKYVTITVDSHYEMDDVLHEWGKVGWELVTVLNLTTGYHLIFKMAEDF